MKPMIAGNWKMHKTPSEGLAWLERFLAALSDVPHDHADIVLCVPFTHIRSMAEMADGTAVFLLELEGDVDRAATVIEGMDRVESFDLSPAGDRLFAYVHARPSPVVRDLLRIVREHEVVLDYPIRFVDDGGLAVTAIGDRDSVRELVDHLPETVGFEVREFGEYDPTEERIASRLTERQTEVLAMAVAMGYYENPRQTTCRELGEELECTAGTVAEHLRVIESKVLPAVASDSRP
jgi:SAM-dependent methyltransferase